MMIYRKIYLAVAFGGLLTISCSKDVTSSNSVKALKKIALVELPLPDNANSYSFAVKYFQEKDDEFLFWHNDFNNSIELYDLASEKHLQTIKFPSDGPEKILSIEGFTVFNLDSIYLSTELPGKLFRVNYQGELKETINYANEQDITNANNYAAIGSKYSNNLYRINSKQIVIPVRMPFLPSSVGRKDHRNYSLFKIYNFENQQTDNTTIYTPVEMYQSAAIPFPFIRCSTFDGEYIYYTFESDHHVYYTSNLKDYQKKK